MKIFCLLLLIAVTMEKCNGNYLLVEVDEGKGKFFCYTAEIALIDQYRKYLYVTKCENELHIL